MEQIYLRSSESTVYVDSEGMSLASDIKGVRYKIVFIDYHFTKDYRKRLFLFLLSLIGRTLQIWTGIS